jgi:hypothetical protein
MPYELTFRLEQCWQRAGSSVPSCRESSRGVRPQFHSAIIGAGMCDPARAIAGNYGRTGATGGSASGASAASEG